MRLFFSWTKRAGGVRARRAEANRRKTQGGAIFTKQAVSIGDNGTEEGSVGELISWVWCVMILSSVGYGAVAGSLGELSQAAMDGAAQAVELSLTMAGTYMLWMGIMEIAQQSGMTQKMAKVLSYPLSPLFPGIRRDSDAMGAICLNISANVLGMGNAATPFGLRAMEKMHEITKSRVASDDMIMLIVINCSSVQLIPTSIIALRAAAGSLDPAGITIKIILATTATTVAGILMCLALRRRKKK